MDSNSKDWRRRDLTKPHQLNNSEDTSRGSNGSGRREYQNRDKGYGRQHDRGEVERGYRRGGGGYDRRTYQHNSGSGHYGHNSSSRDRDRGNVYHGGSDDRNRSYGKRSRSRSPRDRSQDSSKGRQSHNRRDSTEHSLSKSDVNNEKGNYRAAPDKEDPGKLSEDDEDLKPISLNISCPAATTLVKQIEQRKLLFSKKDKPVEATSSSVWQQTTFSDDSDGKMSAKFKRLMGMKNQGDSDSHDSSKPTPGTQSKDFFVNLEKQYEVARTITHTQRGVGFGFSSSGSGLVARSGSSTATHPQKHH